MRYLLGFCAAGTNPDVMDQWYSPDTQTLSEYVTDGKTYRWQTFMDAGLVEEAPLGNILYSRFNGYWVANPIQTDVPSDGQPYMRINGAWEIASEGSIPSYGTPHKWMVNITVQSVTFSRGDHVHPTDTSLASLSGAIMGGILTLVGNPVGDLDAVPKQYVDNSIAVAVNIDCGTY